MEMSKVNDTMQAHISMLENNNRGLSDRRLQVLFELYQSELINEQVRVLVSNF